MKLKRREEDHVAETISLLMKIANVFDEKGLLEDSGDVTVTNCDIGGLGYRALTGYLRKGIEVINNLQSEKFFLKEKIRYLEWDLNDRIYIEDLSEESQKKARAYVEKLRKKEEEEEKQNED